MLTAGPLDLKPPPLWAATLLTALGGGLIFGVRFLPALVLALTALLGRVPRIALAVVVLGLGLAALHLTVVDNPRPASAAASR